ncbi:MAG: MurR/RpiR family transcriptional regulator [Lachnospiraceae bacterium]|nr:MurR/RpiR family transcriptional regulator [Lachnospiraceae bacterium]
MIPLFEKAHRMTLTNTEQEILTYFETHLPSAIHTDLNRLSSELYTSNATIVRFCQKLGLRGFNEFKYQVRSELKELRSPAIASDDLISHTLALFKDNMDAIDQKKLEQIANLLTGDAPVYIYGSYLSSLAARYLQTILNTLDYPSILIEWQRLLNGLIYEITPGSVLLIITAHGDAIRYLPVFQRAKERNAVTILLTCEDTSPLIPYSTIWMCTNDKNEEYHHVDINPRIGIFTIIQLLIELVAEIHENNTKDGS